ncbi:xanthine dehydrogenase family protein molybdopterin-binding subunit [Pontivivens insulae]|uniref:Carbon monoxide dehydrogenase large chain n=1 Tax=Pontivivens insulae TaxID=1639689 RepID=A0A2R8A7K9_9RHOB|nr:xanthine dehydrogenase family protein molybdopterin-binding subunit [Pontivivens insulae]RED18113.1 carbon-monoxide dehydrogenase large subunit [Pontivivens insulae]SPF28010.1 Carbon monoxide dehydrogenase large chain [Pontivivens insulae]
MKFGVGQSVKRIEDPRFLRGEGAYVDDLEAPDALVLHVLRSDIAHGLIQKIDVSRARGMPGVHRIYTDEDLSDRLNAIDAQLPLIQADGSTAPAVAQPHLAHGKVRYVGEPLVAIIADNLNAAMDAAECIEVETDTLDTALKPAVDQPQLHDHLQTNKVFTWDVGDLAATQHAFAEAAHCVALHVVNQRLAIHPVETRGILAIPDGDGWSVWLGNQGVHAAQSDLSRDLQVAPEHIRVHAPDVGGGFGMKLMDHPEYAMALIAAQDLGRPVRWTGTRSESFLSDMQGRDVQTHAEAAFSAEGRLTGLRWRSTADLGAYVPGYGAAVPTLFSGHLIGGLYDVAHVHHVVEGFVTNKAPVDAYRGAGKPEILHVMERLMDEGARATGLDPVEIRLRNLIRPEQIPYETAGGIPFDALDAPAILRQAADLADVAGFGARKSAAPRGLGISCYYERTGGGPTERAKIDISRDGKIRAVVGTQSSGQGHDTAWAQIIAEELGVPFDTIELQAPSTDLLEAGGGTGGSRSAVQAGRSFLRASADAIAQALPNAAEMLEVAATDITFDKTKGAFTIVGTDRSIAFLDVVEAMDGLTAQGGTDDKVQTTPNGCHIAEVSLDVETGQITLERYTVVDDFGRVINPMLVEGQVHGGVTQGIGQVLCEAMIWDEDGQPLSGSLMDYALPRAADLPFFEVAFVEHPTPSNPMGLKGCGEAGSVAAVPAVANAVMDVLATFGVRELAPPYTPGRVWAALSAAKG